MIFFFGIFATFEAEPFGQAAESPIITIFHQIWILTADGRTIGRLLGAEPTVL